MNTLSHKTLGHLIQVIEVSRWSKSEVRDLLMQSGLCDAAGLMPISDPDINRQEMLRIPLLAAREQAVDGDSDVHSAMLEIVRLTAERAMARRSANLSALRESLLADGYELRMRDLGDFDSKWNCRLLPIDPDDAPLSEEMTALEAELADRGYDVAREHYRDALKHFSEQVHPSANAMLRDTIEELVLRLAVDYAGYQDNGKAGQGGRAIGALYAQGGPPRVAGQPLPESDGGRMLRGVWEVLHSNGPHPGLSDADEARIRMQLVTALARFLLKHFPTK